MCRNPQAPRGARSERGDPQCGGTGPLKELEPHSAPGQEEARGCLGRGLVAMDPGPRGGGPGRARRLTALALFHDVHYVTGRQSHLGARGLLIVSDGAVGLQDDGARDIWAEGGQSEQTPPGGEGTRLLPAFPCRPLCGPQNWPWLPVPTQLQARQRWTCPADWTAAEAASAHSPACMERLVCSRH